MSDREARLKLRENAVVWQQIDDATILLDVASSTYLGVNESGTEIWKGLVDGTTRSELIARLREEYQVGEDQATRDVDVFLDMCAERGLLES